MPIPEKERTELLGGPYWTPPCTVGELMDCEFHGVARVKGLTNAPIPWPRVVPIGKMRPGNVSFARCGDLLRAVKIESACAIRYWFGLSASQVSKLRQEYGVQTNNQGSSRLRKIAPKFTLTQEQLKAFREKGMAATKARNTWTPEELALLGKHIDRVVGEMTGRTAKSVQVKRTLLKIPAVESIAAIREKNAWKPEELALLGKRLDREVGKMTGRTVSAVQKKRTGLGIPPHHPTRLRRHTAPDVVEA